MSRVGEKFSSGCLPVAVLLIPWCIGRAGARKRRRLILLISVGWLPPYLCPSGACLALGTRVSCSLLTLSRATPNRGCASSDVHWNLSELAVPWHSVKGP